jgi:hypothetical protein
MPLKFFKPLFYKFVFYKFVFYEVAIAKKKALPLAGLSFWEFANLRRNQFHFLS